jgi:hypothetical protein
MSPLRRLCLVLGALLPLWLCGCEIRDAETTKEPTPEELTLIDRLCRDSFIVLIDQERNDDGYLVLTTQQGSTTVRYLLAPDGPESKQLKIRRMVEDFVLNVQEDSRIGTGPEPRGLVH